MLGEIIFNEQKYFIVEAKTSAQKEFIGVKIHYLTPKALVRKEGQVGYDVLYLCDCECGGETVIHKKTLKRNTVSSCGCYAKRQKKWKHPMKIDGIHRREYNIWHNMHQRCYRKDNRDYKWYGLLGITVCDEWHSWDNFYEWVLTSGYSDNLTIDRIDVRKGYSPENCRWITIQEQQFNKTNNKTNTSSD